MMSRRRVVVVVVEVRVCVVRRKCCVIVRPRWLPGIVIVARCGDVATCSPSWSSFAIVVVFFEPKKNSNVFI